MKSIRLSANRTSRIAYGSILIIILAASVNFGQSGGSYVITQSVLSNGGGESAAGMQVVTGTTGQNIAGAISSAGTYSVQGGFWQSSVVAPTGTISGTITYGNAIGNPAPPRFVKNVSVASTVGSPAVGPVITGTPGTYALTGFGAGSYTIKPTKPGGATTAITSNDAARVAQGVSSAIPFISQNQRFAADVSGNGGVSSNDAALIARFAAGLTGTGNAGVWKFFVTGAPSPLPTPPQTYNDSRTYASVSSNLTGEDFVGILVGEVSGNYNTSTHPRPARTVVGGQLSVVSQEGGGERLVRVTAQPFVTVAAKEIIIPVSVDGVVGKEIISYEFNLRYDPSVIKPGENPVDVTGTVSRGLMVVTNPVEPGLLRVVVYGAMPIEGDGVLLNLRFTAVGAVGSESPLSFERIMFNEGDPRNLCYGRAGRFVSGGPELSTLPGWPCVPDACFETWRSPICRSLGSLSR